jgi:FKBP12-rapamycin complex-associated protein
LTLLGHLAIISGPILLPYLNTIISQLVEILQDQSSTTKREAALRTLGIIASNTGCVVDIYEMYPAILDIMINLLKSEQNAVLRRETIKLIGILGALDPYKQRVNYLLSFKSIL